MNLPPLRPLVWVAGSKKDFAAFPERVQDDFGYRLYLAQTGARRIPGARPLADGPLKGMGIEELTVGFAGDAYRTVYTVRLGEVVYVLHAFKKKSKRGIATPRHEIETIGTRYAAARVLHAARITNQC